MKERVTLQITLISAIFLFYSFPNGIFNFRCSLLLGVWLVGWLVVFRKALGYSNGQDKNHPPEKERFKRRYTQLLFYFFVQLLFYFKYNGNPIHAEPSLLKNKNPFLFREGFVCCWEETKKLKIRLYSQVPPPNFSSFVIATCYHLPTKKASNYIYIM